MVGGVVQFLGSVNLLAYLAADLYFAFVLSRLKADHPDIDEASERSQQEPHRGYGHVEEGGDFRVDSSSNANSDPITLVLRAARDGHEPITGEFSGLFSSIRGKFTGRSSFDDRPSQTKKQLVHLAVIVASFGIPVFGLLQVFFPNSLMSWSMFHVPSWLGLLAMVPALMVVVVYCARAARISSFAAVTKTEWLSMTWFRLDVTCLMAVFFLIGWGDWFLAVLWGIVAGYLAYCLLATERTLQGMMANTQLMRDETDVRNQPGGGVTAGGGFSNGSGLLRETLNSQIPNTDNRQFQEAGVRVSNQSGASYGAAPTDAERRQIKQQRANSDETRRSKRDGKKSKKSASKRGDNSSDDENVEMGAPSS